MVSSALDIPLAELVERLHRIAADNGGDEEYRRLRAGLPEDFPF